MHALLRASTALVLICFATSLMAKDQQQSVIAKMDANGKQIAASTSADQQAQQNPSAQQTVPAQNGANSATQTNGANPGQVIRHNGRWWFRQPNQQWLVWQNNAWTPYRVGMFAGANLRATRRYSYEPQLQPSYSTRGYYGWGYPRMYRAPAPDGASRSIRYAGSKANFDYAPYTGGTVQ